MHLVQGLQEAPRISPFPLQFRALLRAYEAERRVHSDSERQDVYPQRVSVSTCGKVRLVVRTPEAAQNRERS